MLEQDISEVEVRDVLESGEVIEETMDQFGARKLLHLHAVAGRPLHVLTIDDDEGRRTEVITAYEPDLEPMAARLPNEETAMKCGICGHGETRVGTTTVTLQKGGVTVVFKDVPAEICENCGERYVSEPVTSRLLEAVQQAAASGVQVEVRSFAA